MSSQAPNFDPDAEGPRIDPEDVTRFRQAHPEILTANEAAARHL